MIKFFNKLSKWNNLRKEEEALRDMSDRLLKDIGISRSEISYRVRHGGV